MQDSIILKTRNLSKQYTLQQTALHPVNITVYKRDIYGIVGADGAGKTTLLKLLAGLSERTSGDFELLGKSGHETTAERERIPCLIGEPAFFDGMTVYQNLKYYALQRKVPLSQIENLLKLLGLTDAEKIKFKKATPEIRQKLAIALALTLKPQPELLLLDEPFRNLSPADTTEVSNVIRQFNRKNQITAILSSRNLSELLPIANRILLLDHGKAVKEFPAEAVSESGLAPEEYVKSLIQEGRS